MFDERIAIGLPSLAGYSLHDGLRKAAELGFQAVVSLPDGPRAEHSLGPFPTLGFYGADASRRQAIAAALAPFRHRALHQAWDDEWERWLDCAAAIRAEVLTIHAGRPRDGQSGRHFLAERSAWFRRIGDAAAEVGVRIGVENEGGRYDAYLELIAAIAHPCVGATLDIGHCAYFDEVLADAAPESRAERLNDTISALIRDLDRCLNSMHAHDVRGHDWRDHRRVASGVIDFPRMFAELGTVRYTGLLEIELEEPDREKAAEATGEYLTGLCRQFLTV